MDAVSGRRAAEQQTSNDPTVDVVAVRLDECPGHCFDAILVSVDEDDWHLVRVQVLSETSPQISAVVHRTAGYGATDPPAGTKIEFTCTHQYHDSQGVRHYVDCYQGSPRARAYYEIDATTGLGDLGEPL